MIKIKRKVPKSGCNNKSKPIIEITVKKGSNPVENFFKSSFLISTQADKYKIKNNFKASAT